MRPLTPLPIDARLPEALELLERHRRLVLVAEPGAGKTTRLPRALLLANEAAGDQGEILVLEPRRLAARLSAQRVAEELGEKVGERAGYAVRFDRKVSSRTRIVFLTEALLTRRLVDDPRLDGVSVVVFDEFHERSLHADLGLALAKLAQSARPSLRIVVTSATLDARALCGFLDAPLLEVEGRAHPVAIEHAEKPDDRALEAQVAAAVRRVAAEDERAGDVLVFLPGAAEMRRAEEACADAAARLGAEIALLHGDLPPAEQDRALRASGKRKIILATNVAETSITVPTVTAVVDTGLRREARHSPWSGLPTLVTAKISQASATQRAGRAGRTGPGRCVRLFTKHDFAQRPAHDDPEVRRADLAETALYLASAGHDPRAFPYFEAPPAAALGAALELLERLGALEAGAVTEAGRRMAELPVHPRLARVLLEARERGVGARGCLAAALLGEREIRLAARTRFGARDTRVEVGGSDVVARIEAFEAAEAEGFSARAIRYGELDANATRSVARVRDRLARALRVDASPRSSLDDEEEALGLALLAGYPDRVGRWRDPNGDDVVFADGGSARLDPASVVREAELLVALDAGEHHGRRVIRAASSIEPEWLLELFPDRVADRRELRFDEALGQVVEVAEVAYGAVALDRSVRRDPEGPEVARVLADAAIRHGVDRIWDADARERLARRLAFAAAHGLPVRVLDDALLREAVASIADGARGLHDLRGRSLVDAILALEPAGAR